MAELAPVDELGMPYLLHPYEPSDSQASERNDDDHSFYQRKAPELTDQAGRALRYSRVQTIPRWLHCNKHHAFPDGTALPQTEADKFALTVLSCAGYVSKTALDTRDRENPRLVRASTEVHELLQGQNQVHMQRKRNSVLAARTEDYSKKAIGMFFAEYVRQQNVEAVDELLIEEFLYSESAEKRRKLGNKILGHFIRIAVEPVEPKYRHALKDDRITPAQAHPFGVVSEMFPRGEWHRYHATLTHELAA